MTKILSMLLVIWLVVGAFVAFQRGYFGDNADVKCAEIADTGLTVVAGPLNYVGVNPKVDCKAESSDTKQDQGKKKKKKNKGKNKNN